MDWLWANWRRVTGHSYTFFLLFLGVWSWYLGEYICPAGASNVQGDAMLRGSLNIDTADLVCGFENTSSAECGTSGSDTSDTTSCDAHSGGPLSEEGLAGDAYAGGCSASGRSYHQRFRNTLLVAHRCSPAVRTMLRRQAMAMVVLALLCELGLKRRARRSHARLLERRRLRAAQAAAKTAQSASASGTGEPGDGEASQATTKASPPKPQTPHIPSFWEEISLPYWNGDVVVYVFTVACVITMVHVGYAIMFLFLVLAVNREHSMIIYYPGRSSFCSDGGRSLLRVLAGDEEGMRCKLESSHVFLRFYSLSSLSLFLPPPPRLKGRPKWFKRYSDGGAGSTKRRCELFAHATFPLTSLGRVGQSRSHAHVVRY